MVLVLATRLALQFPLRKVRPVPNTTEDLVTCSISEGPPIEQIVVSADPEGRAGDHTFYYAANGASRRRMLHVLHYLSVEPGTAAGTMDVTLVSTNHNKVELVYRDDRTGSFTVDGTLIDRRPL